MWLQNLCILFGYLIYGILRIKTDAATLLTVANCSLYIELIGSVCILRFDVTSKQHSHICLVHFVALFPSARMLHCVYI